MKKLLICLLSINILLFSQNVSLGKKNFTSFNSAPYLTPTVSPTNSVMINWNTKLPTSSDIAYGTSNFLKDTVHIEQKTNYHHIALNNLKPNTEYYYKILTSDKVYKFKTFSISADSFSFIVFGDTRSDSIAHQAVIDRMPDYDFEFLIHTGDLVAHGEDSDAWYTFFSIEGKILNNKIFLPTIGNHEKPFWQYDTLFSLPGVEYFYGMRYGNAYIICLNTEMKLNGLQQKWLVNMLHFISTDTTIDWIFVSLHRPPYSSGSHGSALDVRKIWSSIFEKYGVDIVFCGHDHSYERTKKINGVIYIVSGGGGAPLYDVGISEWTDFSLKTHHFCYITIKKNNLILQAIKPDGSIIDSLTLQK